MGQQAKTKTVDSRKPKHSNDSSRPSKTPVGKGGKEHRDASTVSAYVMAVLSSCPYALYMWFICRCADSTCTRPVPKGIRRGKLYMR